MGFLCAILGIKMHMTHNTTFRHKVHYISVPYDAHMFLPCHRFMNLHLYGCIIFCCFLYNIYIDATCETTVYTLSSKFTVFCYLSLSYLFCWEKSLSPQYHAWMNYILFILLTGPYTTVCFIYLLIRLFAIYLLSPLIRFLGWLKHVGTVDLILRPYRV